MGDSSEMTIEFLRARLLSERSVSRMARQRAEQLAKRVAELEEQLRIVTIQRRKAERAAAEVLSILDMQGIGESSEVIDSSSDHDEVSSGSKGSNGKAKEEGSSTTSGVNGSEVDDGNSASDLQVSSSKGEGRSLSWKSRMSGNPPERRRRSQQVRHRRSSSSRFVYNSESTLKTYLGKSCRKIKRSDKGSGSEHGDQGGLRVGSENERNVPDDTCVRQSQVDDGFDDHLQGKVSAVDGESASKGDNNGKRTQLVDGAMSSHPLGERVEYLNGRAGGGIDVDKDGDMERELEKQAELINQYRDEENAQREWEEKFSRTDGKMGEAIILADESEEMIKLDKDIDLPRDQLPRDGENKLGESFLDRQKGISNNERNCVRDNKERNPSNESSGSSVGYSSNASTSHVNFHGFSGQIANGTINVQMAHRGNIQGQGALRGNSDFVPNGQHQMPHINGFHEKAVDVTFPVKSSKSQAPESHTSSAGPLVSPDHGLGGVLDALHRAKSSLRQEMSKMLEPTHSARLANADSTVALATVAPATVASAKHRNMTGIPISTAGLFRLPTDPLPGSDTVGPSRYLARFELPGMSVSNRNLAAVPNNSYSHVASSGFQSRLPVRKLELGSYRSSGSGASSSFTGRTIPHFHADSSMLGSFAGYGNQKPYAGTQNEQFPSNRCLNGTDFQGRR